MSCIIYSKSKNIPVGIWSRLKSYANSSKINYLCCDLDDLSNNFGNIITDVKPTIVRQGFGTFMKVDNQLYVITCFHIIDIINMEIFAFVLDEKENNIIKLRLNKVKEIPELDLIILRPESDDNDKINVKYYDQYTSAMRMSDILSDQNKNKIFLNTLKVSGIKDNNMTLSRLEITNVDIANEHFVSVIIPKLPMITFKCKGHFENNNIEGLSGSILTINENVIGMITNFDIPSDKFEALPMILLYKIMEQVHRNRDKNLRGYNISTGCIKKLFLESIQREQSGRNVLGATNMYKTNIRKDFMFKKGDIILGVDDESIVNTGKIYYELLDCEIDFNAYLMFKSFFNENNSCKFNFARQEKRDEKEKIYNVNLINKHFNDLYATNIFNNHEYVYWRGFIFAEMSEEILNDIKFMNNKKLSGLFATQLKLTSGEKKHVIIIDVDKTIISDSMCEIINLLPFVESYEKDKIYICFLEKIGNKKINSLNDLRTVLETNNNKKMLAFYQTDTENIYFTINNKLFY